MKIGVVRTREEDYKTDKMKKETGIESEGEETMNKTCGKMREEVTGGGEEENGMEKEENTENEMENEVEQEEEKTEK